MPNQPEFIFAFHVNGPDIVFGSSMFFNVVFGDYDVVPADITLMFASAPSRTIAPNTQPGAEDGLIQAAFANLGFSEGVYLRRFGRVHDADLAKSRTRTGFADAARDRCTQLDRMPPQETLSNAPSKHVPARPR